MLTQFEYPLPELSVDISEIEVETHNVFEGSFHVRNKGGGQLSGQIISHSPCAEFTPDSFEGHAQIRYRVYATGNNIGDIVRTGAVIISNGGELFIPITLTVTAASILTEEGITIINIRTFLDYARQYPNRAANMMNSPEFKDLLVRTNFEFIEAYKYILTDENKQRALECLLRLSGLKKGAKVNVIQRYTDIRLKPFQREMYYGRIPIKMEGWGYVDDIVYIKNKSEWLNPLSTVSQALYESGMFNYSIDPSLIKGRYASDSLILASNPEAEAVITVIREPYLKVKLNKESYNPNSSGVVYVKNYTDLDLMLEIQPSQPYVAFEAKKHYVGEYAEIPFQIKLSTFQSMAIKKQPAIASINIQARVRDDLVFRQLKIRIGDFS